MFNLYFFSFARSLLLSSLKLFKNNVLFKIGKIFIVTVNVYAKTKIVTHEHNVQYSAENISYQNIEVTDCTDIACGLNWLYEGGN